MAPEQEINHDYDLIARFYDAAAGWTLNPARKELAASAIELGAPRVLDVGCGTGLQLYELAKQGLEAVGVDNSPAMLQAAERRLARLPDAQRGLVSLRQASGVNLPLNSEGFDLCILSLLLHESGDEPFKLLDSAFAASPRLFVLDWSLAERNLDYPGRALVRIVERLAGRRHYASYAKYMRQGALEGLMERYRIYRRESGLRGLNILGRKQLALNTLCFMDLQLE